jgi:integrase
MVDDDHARVSLLGFEPRPSFLISNLFEAYEGIKSVSLMSMSPDQIRKWRNPKKRAIANLIDVIGDLPIDRLTRSHALEFRDAWRTRVLDGAVKSDTANKDLSHISTMLKAVIDENRLSLVNPFDGLALDVGKAAKRIPYANDFIQNHLLKNGALSGLNTEARRVLYLMVETGLRLSEAVNLTHETIKLDDDVPHVQIRADGRKLKTDVSERDIPLVGVSLDVMRLQPHGFPRYRDKSASLSSTVNKFLRENDLSPHGETAYSLRHSFDDRLINSGAGDKVVAALMGHTYKRMDYGRGPSLTVKRDALLKIAFDPPVDL